MIDAYADQEKRQEEEKKLQKAQAIKHRRNVQAVMNTVEGRQTIWAFLQIAGQDISAYREKPQAMAHAVGWHDAAAWWIEQIRLHCPEKEGVMRTEARKEAREIEKEITDD